MVRREDEAEVRDEDVEARVVVREVLDVAEVERARRRPPPRRARAPSRASARRCRSRSPSRRARAARIATSPVPRREVEHPVAGRDAQQLDELVLDRREAGGEPLVRADAPGISLIVPEHTFGVGDLFSEAAGRRLDASRRSPSACGRRRSTTSSGQEHVIGPGRALRLAIEQDRVPSMILYGPPGSGKTTLARIVAQTTGAEFEELSAVSATVANVREVLARARERLGGERPADDPLPRRDPPLQQGAAGRAAARRRGRPRDADRRDDREPVLRGQLGAALAHADLRARAALDVETLRGVVRRGAAALDVDVPAEVEELIAHARRRRRAQRAQHPRAVGRDGARRGRRARDAARRRRGAQAAARLRQGRRRALRLHLGVDQVDPRGRRAGVGLLPGRDARGRRGRALHRAPDDRARVRGHRQRRPAGAARRGRGGARGRARRACPRRASTSRRRPSTSRARRSRTRRTSRSARRRTTCASAGT